MGRGPSIHWSVIAVLALAGRACCAGVRGPASGTLRTHTVLLHSTLLMLMLK